MYTMKKKTRSLLAILVCLFLLAGCDNGLPAAGNTAQSAEESLKITSVAGANSLRLPIPEEIRFTHIGLEEGLSQSTVHSGVQDSQGFMWFGTEDGLNRFDGYDFKVFRPDPTDPKSLSDRWITALAADSAGNLWVGTRQGGLNFYNSVSGEFTRYLHDEEKSGSLAGNQIQTIYIDHLNRVWVGTEFGLDLYSPEKDIFIHYLPVPFPHDDSMANDITSINEDSEGNLWIGSASAGLFMFDPVTVKFTNYRHQENDRYTLTSNSIRGIQNGGEGVLWIATDNGINLFRPKTGIFVQYRHSVTNPRSLAANYVQTMLVDSAGNLWVGTDEGLDRFNPVGESFVHYSNDPGDPNSLKTNIVQTLYESSDGILWVGTFGGSINKYDRTMDNFRNFKNDPDDPDSIAGNIIFKVFIDNEQFAWIGTVDGGLSRLNLESGKAISFRHNEDDPASLSSNEVWAIFKDSENILWVGTTDGLDRLDPGASGFIHYERSYPEDKDTLSGMVYDIVEDRYNNLWLGTSRGLTRYNRRTGTFTHFVHDGSNPDSISGSSVVKVYIDNYGNLWLGTFSSGLDRYDLVTGKFIHYRSDLNVPGSLSNNAVISLLQDSNGGMWVGTDGGGLNYLDPATNMFTTIREKDGLPNDVVYGILEDEEGRLWLSTNLGISCYNPADKTFMNFTESDGLQGNEFDMNAYAEDASGNMYFGGVNGLTVFNPETIEKNSFIPPVVLLSITQNGVPLTTYATPEKAEVVTIRWPYNSFEFEFASLSYSDPSKNRYAYMLENFDDDWIDARSWREGRYTNLPGGTYILHLKGTNRDGVWNDEGHSITIKVVPAVWQTLWFRALTVILLLGLAAAIYRARTRSIQENNRELERQVVERTKEIERLFEKTKELAVVKERNRLARELHDSAKQKAFAALAQLGTAGGVLPGNPNSARAHLQEAENLVYEVIEELTFLIQEMYPLALKEKGLSTSLRDYIFDWEARTDIQVKVDITDERRLHLDVEQAFYRAIQESLSNVARHSRATEVTITLTFLKKELIAIVRDNGCGFDKQTRQYGMGLRTIRERIEALGGVVQVESAPDCGTCITMSAPLRSHRAKKGETHHD
jgi:ligand-binding sensor domain-containing protein/signal transduction histidine kinase